MGSFISQTVRWILNKFDEENITYAILRNYEILPEIGHDLDMICREDDFAKVRNVLKLAKEKFSWNNMVEVKLWESYIDDFTIKVFKFFNFEKDVCLQIDIFGGYTIWSAPAVTLESLLQRRVRYKFFYKISNLDEILIRSMQLACAIRDKEKEREKKIINVIDKLGGRGSVKIAYELLPITINQSFIFEKSMRYKKGFELFKKKYFLKHFISKPIISLFRFVERVRFRFKTITWAIPGLIVFINSKSYFKHEKIIMQQLKSWDNGQIIPGYVLGLNILEFFKYYKKLIKGHMLIIPCRFAKKKYHYNYTFKNEILKKFTIKKNTI